MLKFGRIADKTRQMNPWGATWDPWMRAMCYR